MPNNFEEFFNELDEKMEGIIETIEDIEELDPDAPTREYEYDEEEDDE